jgi:N-acetylneuraminic acid mutarotase
MIVCILINLAPYFFFHGGRNKEISLGDTYFLDTDTWKWRKAFTIEQPPARYHHAVVKGEGKDAYIFGGYDDKKNRCFGDLHRYEYSKLSPNNRIT